VNRAILVVIEYLGSMKLEKVTQIERKNVHKGCMLSLKYGHLMLNKQALFGPYRIGDQDGVVPSISNDIPNNGRTDE
jgi:hypothetical protein